MFYEHVQHGRPECQLSSIKYSLAFITMVATWGAHARFSITC